MPISPLSDVVYEQILALIGQQGLVRDARLPGENEMAERFGVSRPIVRQALARLRAEGRAYARRGAGNFVDEPPVVPSVTFGPLQSIPDVRSFLDFRCVLEGESAARAAQCADPALLRDIGVQRLLLEAASARGETCIEEDIAFHGAIALASGNRFFVLTMASLREQTRFAIRLIRELSPQPLMTRASDVRNEHRSIDEAIARGDAEAARDAMTRHLRGGIARLFGR